MMHYPPCRACGSTEFVSQSGIYVQEGDLILRRSPPELTARLGIGVPSSPFFSRTFRQRVVTPRLHSSARPCQMAHGSLNRPPPSPPSSLHTTASRSPWDRDGCDENGITDTVFRRRREAALVQKHTTRDWACFRRD